MTDHMASSNRVRPKLRLALMAMLATLLAACGQAKDEVPTLRVGDQLKVLQAALAAAGEDKPEHYRIEWSNFIGGPAVIAAQTGGSLDVGWMAETPLVFAQAAGSPVKVVTVGKGAKPGSSNVALVVAADSPIRSVQDLKGKKVGYGQGTITHYLVARLLENAGLSIDDVTQVRVANLNPKSIERGLVDAYSIAEPMLSQGLSNGTIRVIAYGGEPITPGFAYLVASDAALADPKRAELIRDLAARFARAIRFQREHPAKAAPFTAQQYNTNAELAEQILRRTPSTYAPIDASIVAKHQEEADLFYKLGLIRKPVDAAKLFDNRFDQHVIKALDASDAN